MFFQFLFFERDFEMKITVHNNSLPPDDYLASFEGIEDTSHREYGEGWKWIFVVCEGEHKGRECYRTTKNVATPGNSCGRFLAALSGTDPVDGFSADPDDYLGKVYRVKVEASPSGESTRIASFVPAEDGPF